MGQRDKKLEDIEITEPCHAAWKDMPGSDRARFCDQCELHVHNIAALKRDEAEELLAARDAGERLCVRLELDSNGECITADTPRRPGTGLGKVAAAAALALGAGLTGCSTDGDPVGNPEPCAEQGPGNEQESRRLLGRVAFEVIGDAVIAEPQTSEPEAPHVIMGTPGPRRSEDD